MGVRGFGVAKALEVLPPPVLLGPDQLAAVHQWRVQAQAGGQEMTPEKAVRYRSGGVCEAMVLVEGRSILGEKAYVWTRCGRTPVEVHHRLTRGRGGELLDELGETYHLLALCPGHHRDSDGKDAYAGGLLLAGSMIKNQFGVYYEGPDPVLSQRYPKPRRMT